MKVYVDAVMGINFLVDFLLLLGTNRLSGFPSNKKRVLAASVFGAAYSGVCLLPDFLFLGNLIWRFVSLALMAGIAFGWERDGICRGGIFLILSLALGGLAVSIGQADLKVLAAASLGLWCLCRVSFPALPGSRRYIPLQIIWRGKSVSVLALQDTGNTLRDPVTGQQAMVLSAQAASRLTGLTLQQIQNPLETMASKTVPGLRLLPYRTVGQGSGMMLAMLFEDTYLNGRKQRALVAFAPENFGENTVYQALTGGIVS